MFKLPSKPPPPPAKSPVPAKPAPPVARPQQPTVRAKFGNEFSSGQGSALRRRALEVSGASAGSRTAPVIQPTPAPVTRATTATTLLNESIGDGRSNCLEAAYSACGPDDTVTLLRDRRDPTGHAVVERSDGTVFDPSSQQKFASMESYLAANQHYTLRPEPQARAIPRASLEQVFNTQPNSAARSGALAATGLSAIGSVAVADTMGDVTAQVAAEVRAAAGPPTNADSAQLMSLAYTSATEAVRLAYPNASVQERMDRVAAMTFVVLNGNAQLDWLRSVDNGSTDTLRYIDEIIAADPSLQSTCAGFDLDSTSGGGTLEPRFNDGTSNQAFHTNYFITAGYVSGGEFDNVLLAKGLAIGHETIDYKDTVWRLGGSVPDVAASLQGITIGQELFTAREAGSEHPNVDLLMPTFVTAYVSERGTPMPRVDGMSDAQYDSSNESAELIWDSRDSVWNRMLTSDNLTVNVAIGFIHEVASFTHWAREQLSGN